MTSQFVDMTLSSNFFDVVLFLFYFNFSYWFKLHVNIVAGSWIMNNFFVRDLAEIF